MSCELALVAGRLCDSSEKSRSPLSREDPWHSRSAVSPWKVSPSSQRPRWRTCSDSRAPQFLLDNDFHARELGVFRVSRYLPGSRRAGSPVSFGRLPGGCRRIPDFACSEKRPLSRRSARHRFGPRKTRSADDGPGGVRARETVRPLSTLENGSGRGVTDPDGAEPGEVAGSLLCEPSLTAPDLDPGIRPRPAAAIPSPIPSGRSTAPTATPMPGPSRGVRRRPRASCARGR